MKCSACGYDESIPFIEMKQGLDDIDGNKFLIYACPKCGVLKTVPIANALNKNHGCKCPWCGNTTEFAIKKEPAVLTCHHFNMVCSCGACGPDADSDVEAIEKFRMWVKNE
jgi:uncharacterized Zn finger protein